MSSYKIEQLPGTLTYLGEGPHWDIETNSLYFIDIYNGTVHRYSYDENKEYKAEIENEPIVSFVIPIEGNKNKFAVGIGRRVGIINWDGKSTKAKVEKIAFEVEREDEKYKNNRFNDGKADPKGHLVAGTMRLERDVDIFDYRLGNLYSVANGGKVTRMRSSIGCSNGLTWNEKAKKMYYIDSVDLSVREFGYDFENGLITDEGRVLIDFTVDGKRPNFVPDGMTIDSEGFLYVATFGACKIFKVDPRSGDIVLEIEFPCEQITSCAFGGPKLDILYATTASMDKDQDKPAPAGATFKITGLGAKGLPMQKMKL